ncbi:hypothetical protein Tco_1183851 [Tanacetum coccineum]
MENDPRCSPESELFFLACGPESNANTHAACVVNGVKFLVHDRNIHRTTQSSRVATSGPNGEMFYGQLEEILKLTYIGNRKGINHILTDKDSYRDQQYILTTHARQVFYLEDPARRPPHWKVVEDVHHRKIWHRDMVEDVQDVIHDSNSSDVALSANLGDLDYTILSTIDESTEVDAPPHNEVPDKESVNFIGDEDDVVPHVLEDDDLDDDVRDDDDPASMACVAPRSHGGDAGGDPLDDRRPRLLPHQCEGSGKRGESKHKALKKAFKQNGYRKLEIVFEAKDQKTFKPVGQYGANFSSYVGELIKEIPQYYDSWEKVPPVDKAPLIPRLQNYFDLQPHLNDETIIKINGKDKTVGSLAEMKAIQDAITAGTIPPKTDRQNLAEVTRSTNRAHIAGVGRNLAGMGNLDSGRSQSDPAYCTREQLEDLKRQHCWELRSSIKFILLAQLSTAKLKEFVLHRL